MYLLDTDVISAAMRVAGPQALRSRLRIAGPGERFTSSLTIGELFFGAYKAKLRTSYLIEQIRTVVLPTFPILAFDHHAAEHYGRLRAHLEAKGTPIGDADTRIAAIALSRGLIIVTGNTRHFERVPGLAVENWLL